MTTEALNTSWEYPPELQQQIDALIIDFADQGRSLDPALLGEIENLLNANGFEMRRFSEEEYAALERSIASDFESSL